jgi:dTMP kinase
MQKGIRFFGEGLPYLKNDDLKGKLIVIEGTDGVGRSTQIDLLEEWLKIQGFGVLVTGWTRSRLMSRSIEMAKNGNMIDRMTLSLLYATDFADRLENEIIPALRSGFVVICDRYIYTAMARDFLRNTDREWIHDVFGFAPIPDLVCYLRIDVENLIPRVIESGGMNYWESGMDLHLADNIFDCFKKYQNQLIDAYDGMVEKFDFEVLDARRSVEEIQLDLRERIEEVIRGPRPAYPALALLKKAPLKAADIREKLEVRLNDMANRFGGAHEAGPKRTATLPEPPPAMDVGDKVISFSTWNPADRLPNDSDPTS